MYFQVLAIFSTIIAVLAVGGLVWYLIDEHITLVRDRERVKRACEEIHRIVNSR